MIVHKSGTLRTLRYFSAHHGSGYLSEILIIKFILTMLSAQNTLAFLIIEAFPNPAVRKLELVPHERVRQKVSLAFHGTYFHLCTFNLHSLMPLFASQPPGASCKYSLSPIVCKQLAVVDQCTQQPAGFRRGQAFNPQHAHTKTPS